MRCFIFWLSGLAVMALVVSYLLVGNTVADAASQCARFAGDPTAQERCAYMIGARQGGAAATGVGLIALAAVLCFVAWLLGVVNTSRTHRWGWFVALLLLTPLASLLYGLAGPDLPPQRQPRL